MTNKTGNLKSEQLLFDGTTILDHDTPIRGKRKIETLLKECLGSNKVSLEHIKDDEVYVYKTDKGKNIILLCAAITYMGGNGGRTRHPDYLNRIQMPKRWKEIVHKNQSEFDIRFLGIYHYKDLYVFTDVVKDTYLSNKMNNSSAHIYIGDLQKALIETIFKRIDQNGNTLISISKENLGKYLEGTLSPNEEKFDTFKKFNKVFMNGEWTLAIDSIIEMKDNEFRHWKQGEWPGWNLEYQFNKFLTENNIRSITYAGNPKEFKFAYDFDLWINNEEFYADLKSSDIGKTEVPGNDIESVLDAIKQYGKLWYVVYEHKTKKDKDYNYEQTRRRNFFIKEEGELGNKVFDELSYGPRMKNSVKYERMFILELNINNYKHYIDVFNQGKQQDGSSRKPKIKFSKHQIENAVVFSETLK